MATYFTRGTGHNEYAGYSERPDDWENNLARIYRKFETARQYVPSPVTDRVDGATVGIISMGSNDPAVAEARDRLAGAGVKTSYLRLRSLPLCSTVPEFIAKHDRIFVVENNFDGQLFKILVNAAPTHAPKMNSAAKCNGMPLSARWITDTILEHLG